MRKYFGTIFDTSGNVVASASVTVYLDGTTTKATLYSDDGITTKLNPVTSDSKGLFWFYVADGIFDLEVSGSNLTTYTIEDVTIRDPIGLTATQTLTNKTLTSPKVNFASASKTTTYIVLTSDFILHLDDSSGSFTTTLPAASSFSGRIFVLGKSNDSANTITIYPNGSDTIEGVTSVPLFNQFDYIALQSDGVSSWRVLSKTWEDIVLHWNISGNLSATTYAAWTWVFTWLKGRILSILAYVRTPSSGASIILDINKNGTTIWSTQANRLTIAIGSNSNTQYTFNTTTLSQDDRLDLDVDQVGSGTSGANATILINIRVQGRYLS